MPLSSSSRLCLYYVRTSDKSATPTRLSLQPNAPKGLKNISAPWVAYHELIESSSISLAT